MFKKIRFAVLGIVLTQNVFAQNALFIPTTLSGTNIHLDLQNGTKAFFSGSATNTMGANGNILGPTIMLNHGDFVNFSVSNLLADTTTLHWHGLHVAPENDGGPHSFIPPNTTWSPSFTIMDKAATYWYHPHLHHMTDMQVSRGISGLIIVRDAEEAALALPRTYGSDDFPLVIQTKDFDANNQIKAHSNNDDQIMVNATLDPFLQLPAQVIRFRILNGSSQRVMNLGLSNGQAFYQIASDGGLLSAPISLTRLLLSPGERAEILVNFSGMIGDSIYLKSFASELPNGIYGASSPGMMPGMVLTDYNPNPLNGSDFNILKFNVGATLANPISSIPTTLANVTPIPEANANMNRTLTFSPASPGPGQLNGNFLINGASMDLNVINYIIPLDNTEIWQLTNQSAIAHPFHIHDVQFYILSRNGVAPAENERGRKDVVLVKPQETVRFITRFEDFANDEMPYMYHCHLLVHEDGGMMGQFIVKNSTGINEDIIQQNGVAIYPNPSLGAINISFKTKPDQLILYNALGQTLRKENQLKTETLHYDNLPAGIYFLQMSFGDKSGSRKVIVF